MATDGLTEMVFTLIVLEAWIMAAKSTLLELELLKEMGTLTINPSAGEPTPDEFLDESGVWIINNSAAEFEPLYVWSDGAYMRISEGMYDVP